MGETEYKFVCEEEQEDCPIAGGETDVEKIPPVTRDFLVCPNCDNCSVNEIPLE